MGAVISSVIKYAHRCVCVWMGVFVKLCRPIHVQELWGNLQLMVLSSSSFVAYIGGDLEFCRTRFNERKRKYCRVRENRLSRDITNSTIFFQLKTKKDNLGLEYKLLQEIRVILGNWDMVLEIRNVRESLEVS